MAKTSRKAKEVRHLTMLYMLQGSTEEYIVKYYASKNRNSTDGKKYFIPYFGGFYIAGPLGNNNPKLGKNTLDFALRPVLTCPNSSECRNTCYALKSDRSRPNVFLKRTILTWLARHDINLLKEIVIDQLKHVAKKYIRIDTAGDIFSQEYLDFWVEIAKAFPEKFFYGYTKCYHLFDFSECLKTKNIHFVNSILPNGEKNFGEEEKIIPLCKKLNVKVCPYRKGHENNKHCMENCFLCAHEMHMGFVEH